jgi:hypothetical protein
MPIPTMGDLEIEVNYFSDEQAAVSQRNKTNVNM